MYEDEGLPLVALYFTRPPSHAVDERVALSRPGRRDRRRRLEEPPARDRQREQEQKRGDESDQEAQGTSRKTRRRDGDLMPRVVLACIVLKHEGRPRRGRFRLARGREVTMLRRFGGIFLAVAVLAAGVLATGCKTTTTAGTQRDDTAIKVSVKAKLAADVRLSTLTNIEVNSTNGIVTLAGKVHNQDEKRFAEQVTKSVKGVVKVNNELQLERKE